MKMSMKMKKLIGAALVAVAAAVPSFAAVELGADIYAVPFNRVKPADADSLYEVVPAGFQVSAAFYFGEIKPFNIGLKLEMSCDEFDWIHDGSSFTEIDGGFNGRFAAGPTMRLSTSTGRHSLHITPGAFFNVMGMTDERADERDVYDVLLTLEGGVHLDVGYNFWVVQKESFGLGLNFGADYAVGFGRTATTAWRDGEDDFDSTDWSGLDWAQHLTLYTGVTFRLGK